MLATLADERREQMSMIRMMAKASELFAKPSEIAKPEILASKAKSPGAASR
jgi:hypothetical protein